MPTAFWSLLHRERRRLAFVVSLAFWAGVLLYWNANTAIGSVPIAWVTGAVYAVVVGVAALVICAFLPSMRYMMEAVAISRLALAFYLLAHPEVGASLLQSPFLLALVVVTGAILVSRVIHGRSERQHTTFFSLPNQRFEKRFIQGTALQVWFVNWIEPAAPEPNFT